ncbi:excalibur calcium-binding domain-containing protein [Streptomyces sp. NBC_01754]|uniref:excalibur calcium-binding domain-containing protein n=1 Tax=Streptomyces sp. NBC_01754 TaxID=2975930 RepID=UPI002DD97B65|nr:excalibur calcium-binding domain-containing protein [Streptomyces sp. NBC_01754]WSC92669.1 excalibur calcium-binding domain-containing protein [Streptomyces sp. NBC_01754]
MKSITTTYGPLRLSAGAAVLALALAGCGGGAGGDAKAVTDTSPTASASSGAERELTLTDDRATAEGTEQITVDALANDTVTGEDGTDGPLLSTFGPARLTLSVDSAPQNGTVAVDGTSLTYTAKAGHTGEDEFAYRVVVKGEAALDAVARVRITVTEPTPAPTPTPTPKPEPTPAPAAKKKAPPAPPSVYYENCDAARAAGAAPVYRGDPGYAAHLDRDNDGVGCEPYGSSSSSGGSSGGSSSTGGSSGGSGGGGGGGTYYANCTAVRAAGAAPIHRGEPGYASHLDRDGDGVACE